MKNKKFHFTSGHLYLILIVLILGMGALFVSQIKTGTLKTEKTSTEVISFAGKQQLVIATVRSRVNIEYGYNPQLTVWGNTMTMPDWGPGSRKVKADGPIDFSIGYDSMSRVFPQGLRVAKLEHSDTVFVSLATELPEPKMLSYSYQGYTDVSKSLISENISREEFFGFMDSLSRAETERIVDANSSFFIGAYAQALGSFISEYERKQHPGKIVVVRLKVNETHWDPYASSSSGLTVPDEMKAKKIIPVTKELPKLGL